MKLTTNQYHCFCTYKRKPFTTSKPNFQRPTIEQSHFLSEVFVDNKLNRGTTFYDIQITIPFFCATFSLIISRKTLPTRLKYFKYYLITLAKKYRTNIF